MYYKIENFKVNALQIPFVAELVDTQLRQPLAEALNIAPEQISPEYRILAKSIDARRGAPSLVYTLVFEADDAAAGKIGKQALTITEAEFLQSPLQPMPEIPDASAYLRNPIVVGSGPAGLLAALYLAKANCAPLVLDRGFDVDTRVQDCEKFFQTRILNEESNLLFGAGGAGTFSDGKLYTRVHDPRADFVLQSLIEAGAPADTGYLKRPHLGSDLLQDIVKNLRSMIEKYGGTFRYGAAVSAPLIKNNTCYGVKLVSGEEIHAPAVIFAHGLGARELTLELTRHLKWEFKGFQIGCRVEHLQEWVDFAQFRVSPRPSSLGAAEYNLICKSRSDVPGSGVTTFCMCPGGEIVPATAKTGQLSSNGMSLRARDGMFANAAVITTLSGSDFGTPEKVYGFLDQIEAQCFAAGGSDYTFPAQNIESFIRRRCELGKTEGSARLGMRQAPLHEILPKTVSDKFADAFRYFDHLMRGFRNGNAVGIESCVSSPIRLTRDPETLQSSAGNLFCAGEGAGYAGGIVSAAIDGLKIAEKMISKFKGN